MHGNGHQNTNIKGFAHIGLVVVVVALAVVGGAGAYVYHSNHKTKATTTGTSSSTQTTPPPAATPTPTTPPPAPATHYLVIKELGIRFKLSADISTAYYKVRSNTTNGKPVIALYLHSTDSSPLCTPAKNPDGIAGIATYKPGQTDPVHGDFSSSFPNAPLIDGLHYYIENEQFDCIKGNGNSYLAIRHAFTAAYPTIEPIPKN